MTRTAIARCQASCSPRRLSPTPAASDVPAPAAPQSQWLSLDALQAKVEALGYKVQKAKLKAACGELYTIDKNGGRVELFVDPTSGAIVGQL